MTLAMHDHVKAKSRGAALRAAGAGLVIGAGVLLVIEACLPDLAAIPGLPSESPPPLSFCGDGVIETLDDGGDAGESCDPGDAAVPGCEGCTFTCPGTMDDAGHCFFALAPSKSFPEAKAACINRGAHAVTPASDRESAVAAALADGGHWLGLVVRPGLGVGSPYAPDVAGEPREPGYRRACTGCYAQGADDAGALAVHSNDAGTPLCLVAENGRWLQTACEVPVAFGTVCEREPVGTRAFFCGGPYCTTLAATAGHKRYVFGPELDEQQAAKFCAAYDEGRLVTFDSREEREQLVREIVARYGPKNTVWIGLARGGDGSFVWDDDAGIGSRPLPWGADQPGLAGKRAYLRIDEDFFDTQLAYVGDDAERRIVACQRR
jgi:hypothetical protein